MLKIKKIWYYMIFSFIKTALQICKIWIVFYLIVIILILFYYKYNVVAFIKLLNELID